MLENIAIIIGAAALFACFTTFITMLLLKKNIKDILQKDALIFDENYQIKKEAVSESFNISDYILKVGKNNIEFVKHDVLAKSFDCSFSGIKTAVINYVNRLNQKNEPIPVEDICCSFQTQAVNGLVEKAIRACKEYGVDKLALAGGVSANSYLRDRTVSEGEKNGIKVYLPPFSLCTDNAAMIACMGYFDLINDEGISDIDLSAVSNIDL